MEDIASRGPGSSVIGKIGTRWMEALIYEGDNALYSSRYRAVVVHS